MPDDPTLLCIRDLLQSAQLLCGSRHKVLSYLVGMALEEATDISVNPKPDRQTQPPADEIEILAAEVARLARTSSEASISGCRAQG